MKAVVLWEPERLEIVDLSLRPLRQGEVLLQVKACSICGSDLEGYHGYHPKMTTPRVMGHEVASVVAEVGPGVTGLSVGDRVAGTGDNWRFADFCYAAIDTGYDGWFGEDQFTYRMEPVQAMSLSREFFANIMKKALLIYKRRAALRRAQATGDAGRTMEVVKKLLM